MRSWKVLALVIAVAGGGTAALAPPVRAASSPWVLTVTSSAAPYAPTFTGNGLLGVRVPAAGQGYAPGTVPAQSELAGFYAQPPGQVQQRANIPTWSTLTFTPLSGGPIPAAVVPHITAWQQSLDLRSGIVTTTMTATGANGATDLTYQVLTDRARPTVGLVQMTVTPHWSGIAQVTDTIDGTPATQTTEVGSGSAASTRQIWLTVKTEGTNIEAALASQLGTSADVVPYTGPLPAASAPAPQSNSQTLAVRVTAGQTYTFTKYVGVEDSQLAADPTAAARSDASAAATSGWNALTAENDSAWATLWRNRIDVVGNQPLDTMVKASQFYLWSSTRAGVDWSVSPAGLSSNGYDGHIFWDAETWMYPSLLAFHPDVAVGMDNYRFNRLAEAEQHAAATGYRGARFPWESALDGTEQIPPPVSVNSEGLFEQHITADIALAQWQYYLATGDRRWLGARGWPVISQAATFWASRVKLGRDGSYHIYGVTGPDEENPNVNDEVYTNVAAMRTLQIAGQAARALGRTAPVSWSRIAAHLVIPIRSRPFYLPEFSGYRGQMVKQADVTLVQYPWGLGMSPLLARNNLDYYVPRTDPTGPSMSDAVNEIDTSALGTPGCSAYVFTERSFQPFIRDPFDQFSETRTGGAFTFMTGIGGFLQEFTYGYSGLRFGSSAVTVDPSLTGQLPGLVLRGLQWHGRSFTISIGPRHTTVSLQAGGPLRLLTPVGLRVVTRSRSVVLRTLRPDRTRTTDALRCGAASATSSQPGAPALAAVDGSPATGWQPVSLPATLTLPVTGRSRGLRTLTVLWGRQWPSPPKTPNVPPPPGPVISLRPASYQVQVSANGRTWRAAPRLAARNATTDRFVLPRGRIRFVRLIITAASSATMPMLEEVTATH